MSILGKWRRLLTCATIDALLIVAAGAAWAAPTASAPASAPLTPVLLVLGVGLVGVTWGRHSAD